MDPLNPYSSQEAKTEPRATQWSFTAWLLAVLAGMQTLATAVGAIAFIGVVKNGGQDEPPVWAVLAVLASFGLWFLGLGGCVGKRLFGEYVPKGIWIWLLLASCLWIWLIGMWISYIVL